MLLALLGCTDPPTPAPVPQADEAAVQAARAAPAMHGDWAGPWTREVLAADLDDSGAKALAAGLDTPLVLWDGRRPVAEAGEVQFLYVTETLPVKTLVERLSSPGGPPPAGELVVVYAGADRAWATEAATRLPWTSVGIIDATASASLYADPTGLPARQLGRMAASVAADHYGLHYVGGGGPYPLGLAAVLDNVPSTDLRSPDVRTRAGAARAIPQDGLAIDEEVAVRLAVATRTTSEDTRKRLAADPEPLVRARAADGLTDVPTLDRLTTDPSSVVRVVAAHRLATLAPNGELGAETSLRTLADAPDAYLRWKAAYGLGSAPDGTEILVRLLGDVDADVRREAAHSLRRRADPAAVEALVAAANDPNSFVRRWVMEALAAFPGDPKAQTALAVGATDPTGLVAMAARKGLGRVGPAWQPAGPPRDDAAIAAAAASPDATTRKDVCKFLAGRPGSVPTLEALSRDPDSEVRKSAVEALGWFADAEGAVLAALTDPDPDVLVTALDALRRNGRGTEAAIVPVTRAADAEVRLRAWEALARLGPGAALETGLVDPDERVRAAVVAVYPDRLSATEASVLVRRAAATSPRAGTDALVLAAKADADVSFARWARGVIVAEDELVHLRFSWNEPSDRPAPYRALRPPVIREYGHPDRG